MVKLLNGSLFEALQVLLVQSAHPRGPSLCGKTLNLTLQYRSDATTELNCCHTGPKEPQRRRARSS